MSVAVIRIVSAVAGSDCKRLTWQLFRLMYVKFILQPINLVFVATALVSAGMLAWTTLSGRSGSRALSTLQTTQLINSGNAIVVDLREPAEYAAGTVTGAKNLPADAIAQRLAELSRFKSRPIILVCAAGQRSAKAIADFTAGGFAEVYNLSGGVGAWRDAGLPLVKGAQKEVAASSGKKEKV